MSNHRAPTRRRRPSQRARVVAVVVVGVLVGGAGAAGFTGVTATDGASEPTPTSAPTETAAPPATEPRTTTDGWRVQDTGVETTMATSSGDGDLVVVNITGIRTDFECTADGAQPSKNGQFVALDLEARAGADFADELAMYPLSPTTDFVALGPDGQQVTDSVGNAAACLPPDQAPPVMVTADQPATGTVVLDVPAGATAVRYLPGGWQWPILTAG